MQQVKKPQDPTLTHTITYNKYTPRQRTDPSKNHN